MKRIVITGASSGLGMGIARSFAAKGWHVGVAARRLEPLEQLRSEFGDRIVTARIDITSADAPRQLNELIESLGGMDIFVQAAGIGKQNLSLDPAIEHNTVMTNCVGFTSVVDTAFNHFAKQEGLTDGRLVVISSVAGTKGLGSAPSYSASKRFESTYMTALEQQARIRGIKRNQLRFTDIRPGFIATDLLDSSTRYPMIMQPEYAIRLIVKAIERGRRVTYIDRRWGVLAALWRMLPSWLWVKIKATTSKKQ